MRIYLCFLLLSILLQNAIGKRCGTIFLTVNAVTNYLEYNWDFTTHCVRLPDILTIKYKSNEGPETTLHRIFTFGKLQGYVLTNITFRHPRFPGNWNRNDTNPLLGSHCFPFWIQSEYRNEILDEDCLKIEPSWMGNYGKLRIGSMMIPGTHDSGAWTSNYISLIKQFLLTQEYNLWGQLVSGIRYFDIRVGIYYSETTKEWINHGPLKCSKMREEFQHLAQFLKVSPKEVVILHMKKFEHPPNFLNKEHSLILNLLQEILGEFILPRSYFYNTDGPKLEEIWQTGRNLIISYNNDDLVKEHDWLWYNINQKWGDTTNVEDLRKYLDKVKNDHFHPQSPFCALMAELTPNLHYIINNFDRGLRYMADEVNPHLNVWLTKFNWSDVVNIVATDFFLGNRAISVSIEANNRKLENIEKSKDIL